MSQLWIIMIGHYAEQMHIENILYHMKVPKSFLQTLLEGIVSHIFHLSFNFFL